MADFIDALLPAARSDAAQKRYVDQLKGFAYVETFDELQAWTEHAVDPLQIANTPLLRTRSRTNDGNERRASKTMLIHDYKGGYNDYESCQGAAVHEDMYSCEYLQSVDSFVYFSHKLVSIPPPTWTNTCHRSGALTLGTFLVEPGSVGVERILECDDLGNFWVARQLALLAKAYNFDGWLINIEIGFSISSWSLEKMQDFLCQLRRDSGPERKVVWYDALTTLDFVWYQNTFNSLNSPFALAAGSILTNYAWTPDLVLSAKDLAEKTGLGAENVYFGIDVWAQNAQYGRNRRITWPREGGGGTGTGLGMQVLSRFGLGVGIFAPGWSFEHFRDNQRAVERSVWLGEELPAGLACECNPERPHESVSYRHNGVAKYAQSRPSGTEHFFFTDFARAFSIDPTTGKIARAHLGSQSVLPLMSTTEFKASQGSTSTETQASLGEVSLGLSGSPTRCVVSVQRGSTTAESSPAFATLRLFDLDISPSSRHELTVTYRLRQKSPCVFSIVIRHSNKVRGRTLVDRSPDPNDRNHCVIPGLKDIQGLDLEVYCHDPSLLPRDCTALLDLISIAVRPEAIEQSCELADLSLEQRGSRSNVHHRLTWQITTTEGEDATKHSGMPWSHTTGTCAYFVVHLDGREIGRAYALEYVVGRGDSADWRQTGVAEVTVTAIGFDGKKLAGLKKMISWCFDDDDNNEWVVVEHAPEYLE